MPKCVDTASLYEDIEFCAGNSSLPGIRGYVFGISKRDIVTWPEKPTEPSNLAGSVVLTGNFVLAADKVFHRIEVIYDSENGGELNVENQGAEGSKTFRVTATFNLPGNEEAVTGYIYQLNNDDMVYLIPQRNGKCRLVGNQEFRTVLTLAQQSGKAVTDANMTPITAACDDTMPAPFYTGTIPTSYGTYSGADCSLTPTESEGQTGGTGG